MSNLVLQENIVNIFSQQSKTFFFTREISLPICVFFSVLFALGKNVISYSIHVLTNQHVVQGQRQTNLPYPRELSGDGKKLVLLVVSLLLVMIAYLFTYSMVIFNVIQKMFWYKLA